MRKLQADFQNEIVKPAIYPITLVEMLFDDPNKVYLTSFHRDLTYKGNTYLSDGNLLEISEINEEVDLKRKSVKFTLSGVSQANLAIALSAKFSNRRVNVYKALIDASDAVVGGDAGIKLIYSGSINKFSMSETPDSTATLVWDTTSIWGDFETTAGRRTNTFDQEAYLSLVGSPITTDRGFDYAGYSFSNIVWGRVGEKVLRQQLEEILPKLRF